MTTIPAPALLASPLTLTAGPLVAYNLLMLLAPMLAAGAAYLLCQELTNRTGPSVVGALLFGLSPYLLGHTLSQHLDLVFVCPLPLLALLVVRYQRGRTSARRFVLAYAGLLLLLLGTSFELFLDTALVTALGFGFALLARREGRAALALVRSLPSPTPLQYPPTDYATDLLNVVVPTATLLAGTASVAGAASQHFVSNIGEKDGYIGVPLLVVALLAVWAERRRGGWLIGALAFAALLLALGPTLTIGGRPQFELPLSTARLPLLSNALPARFSVFTVLGLACLCAVWLARPGRQRLRILVGIAVLLSISPNFFPPSWLPGAWARSGEFGWSTRRIILGVLNQANGSHLFPPHSTVLVFPSGAATDSGYWQAAANMSFALAAPVTPFVPRQIAAAPIVRGSVEDVRPSLAVPRLRAFLAVDRIGSVFVARTARSQWRSVVATATGSAPVVLRDGQLYRVPQRSTRRRVLGIMSKRGNRSTTIARAATSASCRRHVRGFASTVAGRTWMRNSSSEDALPLSSRFRSQPATQTCLASQSIAAATSRSSSPSGAMAPLR